MGEEFDRIGSTRRDFLKGCAAVSFLPMTLTTVLTKVLHAINRDQDTEDIRYTWKTIPVDYLPTLQKQFDRYKKNGNFSNNPTFRKYLSNKQFTIPKEISNARSLIVMAVFTKMMKVRFHYKSKPYDLVMPPQYYDDGIKVEALEKIVQHDIIPESGYTVKPYAKLNMKFLAAHTGLGYYGRNNIIFVPGMGSFITLYAFFTDYPLKQDDWLDKISLHDECLYCRNCVGMCPSNAIPRSGMVLDAGKCITLYNEVQGNFPHWIKPEWHNALMGCMECQLCCPVNKKILDAATGELDEITEKETEQILHKNVDEKLIETLSRKLSSYYPATSEKYFDIFTRNLKPLLK